ncbi:tetratricopeptide repeat protein [Halocola ammonii]
MKKSLFVLTLMFVTVAAWAQPEVTKAYNANDDGDYAAAAKYIEEAIENDRAAGKEKTWRYRGNIYLNIVKSEDEQLRNQFPQALGKAQKSYMKALEMGSNYEDVIQAGLQQLRVIAVNSGIADFSSKEYESAIEKFQISKEITNHFDMIDSLAIYNTALSYEKMGNLDSALVGYQRAAEINYNVPTVYMLIASIQRQQGNEDAALQTVKDARKKYPEDEALLREELNYYLSNQMFDEAKSRLNEAIEKNPEDKNLFYALGVVYDELEEDEKAVEAYKSALEIDPDYFDANFNLGILYYNSGVEIIQAAGEIPPSQQKKYEAEVAKAKDIFKKAVPYLEKAKELEPEDENTLRSLMAIYARTNQDEKYKAIQKELGIEPAEK